MAYHNLTTLANLFYSIAISSKPYSGMDIARMHFGIDSKVHEIARYAEVIDNATLDKWKKDLRLMTKIYKSVPTDYFSWEDDHAKKEEAIAIWEEAKTLFLRFKDNFQKWIYKTVLPKPTEKGLESALEKSIKTSAWNFIYTLEIPVLFPSSRNREEQDTLSFSEFRNNRDKNIKRYQLAATKVFADLDEYIGSQGGPLDRRDSEEHFNVGGVQVIVENWGRGSEHTEAEFHMAMNQLNKRIKRIESAGFSEAIQGLTITMAFDQKEWNTTGKYNPTTDTLTLYPLALAGKDTGEGTLTHECGHRFYWKVLPGQARVYWEDVLHSRGLKITKDDIYRFVQAISSKIDPKKLYEMAGDEDRFKASLSFARDFSDKIKFRKLAQTPIMPWGANEFDSDRYAKLLNSTEGETAQIEEISDYGDTSPIEAFAECFRLWVLKGPNALGPWTREFFGKICRSGGAKIASRSLSIASESATFTNIFYSIATRDILNKKELRELVIYILKELSPQFRKLVPIWAIRKKLKSLNLNLSNDIVDNLLIEMEASRDLDLKIANDPESPVVVNHGGPSEGIDRRPTISDRNARGLIWFAILSSDL